MSRKDSTMNTKHKPVRRSRTADPEVTRFTPPRRGVAIHLRAMHLATVKQIGEGQ